MAKKENLTQEEVSEKVVQKKAKQKRKLDDKTEVTVISNFSGLLYYRSPRTKDEWEWSEYGDEHEMSIHELKTMKAQAKRFFEDKWITFHENDMDVIPHLKIEKYYKDFVGFEDMDEVFDKSVDELSALIDKFTANEKALLISKAREKFESGELVNTHIINLIEEKLQVDVDVNPK